MPRRNPTRAIITNTTPDGAPAYDGAQSCKVILSVDKLILLETNQTFIKKIIPPQMDL